MSKLPGSSISSARISSRGPARAPALACLAGAAALAFFGCSSGYELSIEVSDTTNASCNPSCVQSVWVEALAEFDGDGQCIQNVSMTSLREHGLDGKVDLSIPDGLVGVWVVGHAGPSCEGPVMFDGLASTDSSNVTVPLKCIASCAVSSGAELQATSLVQAARGQCAVGAATTVSAGTMRNLGLDRFFPEYQRVEFVGTPPAPMAGGLASMEVSRLAAAAGACSAVMLYKDSAPVSASCLRFGEPGVCGAAGKTEVGYYEAPALVDISAGYRVVGVIAKRGVTPGTTIPVSGATVTLPTTAPAGSRVEYLGIDVGATTFRVLGGATSTDSSGAFAVYLKEPTQVTVTSQGTAVMRLLGGGTLFGPGGETAVSGAQLVLMP